MDGRHCAGRGCNRHGEIMLLGGSYLGWAGSLAGLARWLGWLAGLLRV